MSLHTTDTHPMGYYPNYTIPTARQRSPISGEIFLPSPRIAFLTKLWQVLCIFILDIPKRSVATCIEPFALKVTPVRSAGDGTR
eukprot:1188953-Prorocentrum_minimum.AAC.3